MEISSKVKQRWSFLVSFAYFTLMILLYYVFFKFAFWALFPFLCSFAIAMMLQRPVNFITRKTPIKRGPISTLMVLLIVLAVLGPIALLLYLLISQLIGLYQSLSSSFGEIPEMLNGFRQTLGEVLSFLPSGIMEGINNGIQSIIDMFSGSNLSEGSGSFDWSIITGSLSSVWSVAKQIPTNLVGILVATVSSIFITIEYPEIVGFIKRQFSEEKRPIVSRTKKSVFSSLGKMGKAYLIIIGITFTEMLIGLGALKLFGIYKGGFIVVIALLTAIVDILPVLGTGTVIIPWAVYAFITGDIPLGIGLLVIYAIITVVRQVIEPKIVGGQLGLPAFMMLIAMFFGVKLFGFIGLFLLPITLVILKILNDHDVIHLWKKAEPEEMADDDENEEKIDDKKEAKKK